MLKHSSEAAIAAHSENRLLSCLSLDDAKALSPYLRLRVLESGTHLFAVGDRVPTAYFPLRAAVSLGAPLSHGALIESALIGRNGMLGAFAALQPQPAPCSALVQVEGEALMIEMDALRHLAHERHGLTALMLRHETAVLAHTQQIAACNAAHPLEARLCRWLLWTRDITGVSPIVTTQQAIATLLGVRRTSVCMLLHVLHQQGIIRILRGRIELRDPPALRDKACECYTQIAAHYQRAITPVSLSIPEPALA
jgi:CRP-like cAMP-binding protein